MLIDLINGNIEEQDYLSQNNVKIVIKKIEADFK